MVTSIKQIVIYIILTLVGMTLYWIYDIAKLREETKSFISSPYNTYAEDLMTKDGISCTVTGQLFFDPITISTTDVEIACNLTRTYLQKEFIKYNKQELLNDSIAKYIFNKINTAIYAKYPQLTWYYSAMFLHDSESYQLMQEYKKCRSHSKIVVYQ